MVDERQVDRWLQRGYRFFRAVSRNPVIHAGLAARGLDGQERDKGWALYGSVLGVSGSVSPTEAVKNEASDAMTELDNWDSPNFSTAQAVLAADAPLASGFLFSQLTAATGPDSVVAVQTFLDRRDRLKAGDAPGVGAEEAAFAVELLAKRRIVNDEIAASLRTLIDQAKQGAPLAAADATPTLDEHTFERYRLWLHGWREVARTTFRRRDYLIALGLASRRASSEAEAPESPTEVQK